jgi:arsenate reductase-like glutaredoxin family protein
MSDLDTRKQIGEIWKDDPNKRRYSAAILYDLYEGAIEKHVINRIKNEIIDPKERKEIASRILDVQLTSRIVDKLSKAYMQNPVRRLVDGVESDEEMLTWYLKNISFDEIGTKLDKNYNHYKELLLYCYYHNATNKPAIKLLEPSSYIVVSEDTQDCTTANIIAQYYGQDAKKRDMLLCVSDFEVWIQFLDGELATEAMSAMENIDGVNIYDKLPYVYARKSSSSCMPYPDESMISVSTLIPMLCGDINYAVKYMSYAMIWGVNVKEELVKRGPNAFFNLLPVDENSPNKPEVGVLKPDIDIKEVFDGIMLQLQLWLNSRGISASVIGSNSGQISSGISKMIDEADVSAIVSKNQETYKKAERAMFDFILHHGHDIWKSQNPSIPQGMFSPNCYVETTFEQPEVIKTKSEIIDEVVKELKDSLISRKRAIKKLNPTMSQSEIDELIAEIQEDRTIASNPVVEKVIPMEV